MIRVLGLALYGTMAASTRQRLEQYTEYLTDEGIELEIQCLLGDEYLLQRFNNQSLSWLTLLESGWKRLARLRTDAQFDLAIVHCELFPLMPSWAERLLLSLPYIYDFDDAFYLKYQSGRLGMLRPLLGNKFDAVIQHAAAVTAGNSTLMNFAKERNANVDFLPTVVDTTRYQALDRKPGEIFTVGWIGSPSTAPYLSQLVDPLSHLGKDGPVKLVVVGGKAPSVPGITIEELPWSHASEIDQINQFDVGVMPLPDGDWARGKCAFKLIQYMACAVPVIGSRIGANIDVVPPECGFLALSNEDWLAALRFYRDNPEDGIQMGLAGRQRVERHYSLERNAPVLANTIRQTLAASR